MELKKAGKRLQNKEENLDRKIEKIDKKNEAVNKTMKHVEDMEKEAKEILDRHIVELEKISQLSREQAKEIIVNKVKR